MAERGEVVFAGGEVEDVGDEVLGYGGRELDDPLAPAVGGKEV